MLGLLQLLLKLSRRRGKVGELPACGLAAEAACSPPSGRAEQEPSLESSQQTWTRAWQSWI